MRSLCVCFAWQLARSDTCPLAGLSHFPSCEVSFGAVTVPWRERSRRAPSWLLTGEAFAVLAAGSTATAAD